jgi:hypothetical protein
LDHGVATGVDGSVVILISSRGLTDEREDEGSARYDFFRAKLQKCCEINMGLLLEELGLILAIPGGLGNMIEVMKGSKRET